MADQRRHQTFTHHRNQIKEVVVNSVYLHLNKITMKTKAAMKRMIRSLETASADAR
ncbi:hypothetical protein INT80_12975 [Gallibacterium anatis]|uniref:Uncharacterized protein n=1 Tax=Gallibacterium anatis TaxID=750 RepID=A0A930Y923_9PAST|nr:hypothetical protein [Gallibacterium anatis]